MVKTYGFGYSIDGQDALATLEPRLHRRDGETVAVIYAHGHSGLTHPAEVLLFDLLFLGDLGFAAVRAGYPVAMGDFENNVWGNDAAMVTVAEAFYRLSGRHGTSPDRVYLMGGSMGFITATNFAYWVQGGFTISGVPAPEVEIPAIAGIIPAVDHNDIRARNYSGYAAEIVASYGGQVAYDAARPTRNPIEYAAALDVPTGLWYSSNDPATLPASVEAYGALADSEMHSLGPVDHTYVGMDLDEAVEFFDAHP